MTTTADEIMELAEYYAGETASDLQFRNGDPDGCREALRAAVESLAADADRYRWLRQRLKVREERSMTGSCKDSIYTRVAQSFFDTPTRGDSGYVDKSLYAKECSQFDAAIDAALKASQP